MTDENEIRIGEKIFRFKKMTFATVRKAKSSKLVELFKADRLETLFDDDATYAELETHWSNFCKEAVEKSEGLELDNITISDMTEIIKRFFELATGTPVKQVNG